jgi:hypothetical protein
MSDETPAEEYTDGDTDRADSIERPHDVTLAVEAPENDGIIAEGVVELVASADLEAVEPARRP